MVKFKASTYNKSRRRHARLSPVRFKSLFAVLSIVGCVSLVTTYAGGLGLGLIPSTGEVHERGRDLADSEAPWLTKSCDCDDCYEPTDFAFTCCSKNTSWCLTIHDHTCPFSQLCAAELIPGGSGAAECLEKWEVNGGIALYIFILLYLFVGLAIVCDDYFVPSLEKISEGLSLSEDVAGATFMAAGSSAPELFVSLADNVIANPPKSIGIGTIIGSAIFNILVIIGLSAILAGKNLALDWRPLGRDTLFYTISIIALILAVYDGQATWYEGVILVAIYIVYVAFMTVNERFFTWLDKRLGIYEKDDQVENLTKKVQISDKESSTINANNNSKNPVEESQETIPGSVASIHENGNDDNSDMVELAITDSPANNNSEAKQLGDETNPKPFSYTVASSRPASAVEAAKEAKLKRRESDPHLQAAAASSEDEGSLKRRSKQNPLQLSKFRADWKSFGRDSLDGKKSFKEVAQAVIRANQASKVWTSANEEGHHLNGFGSSSSGILEMETGSAPTSDPSAIRLTSETSIGASNNDKELVEAMDEGPAPYWECFYWPVLENESSERSYAGRACCDWAKLWQARLWYITSLPLNFLFRFTIPDCNHDIFCEDKEGKEENRKIGYSVSFAMCIVWIAILSHFLTFAAAKFGCIVGISPPVMGLTILAAGTSIPDALSSVIVAKQGQGDMAVANSIGSNVFDILIGLGLPWFLAEIIYETPSVVKVDDLWIGIGFLFGVLFFFLGTITLSGWVLRKTVGVVLLMLYLVYVIFELFLHPLL